MDDLSVAECLLDRRNTRVVDGVSVADRVRSQGKEHLWDARPDVPIDTIVVHYISALDRTPASPFDLEGILAVFCDFGVSSHYLVERDGTVLRLVPEQSRAWHCGGSIMPSPDDRTNVNDFSVGIELVATSLSGFTDEQHGSLAGLCAAIVGRTRSRTRVLGHEHVAGERAVRLGLRPQAKVDPGPLLDWRVPAKLLGARARFIGAGLLLGCGACA